MSENSKRHADHLDDVPDGCGCVEVWEALSAARAASADRSDADEE